MAIEGSWQENVAVVLAAHGDRGDALSTGRANRSLISHRDRLREISQFAAVTAGVLKGDLALDAALRAAGVPGARHIAVFPMFMANGYFVRNVLPLRLAETKLGRPVSVLPPLGLDPGLIGLIDEQSVKAAQSAGYKAHTSRLLLVGHGSAWDPASANATKAAVEAARTRNLFQEVGAAFLEEPPYLAETLAQSPLPAIVAAFMSGDGLHASEDIPAAISESGAAAVYCGSIGNSPQIPALILRAIERALAAK